MVSTLVFEAWINLRENPEVKPDKILQLTFRPCIWPEFQEFLAVLIN